MADVDWKKYDCSICLMIGLIGAAILTGLIAWLLHQAGLSVILLALLTLVIAAVLFWLVDRYCAGREASAQAAAYAGAVTGGAAVAAAGTDSAAEADAEAARQAQAAREAEAARAAEEAAAARAAEERARREAEEKAAAERQAAADREAAERAAAEDAARKAEEEQKATAASASGDRDYDGDGVVEGTNEGTRPAALDGPRGGTADDLKRVKGIGPKMEKICNSLGFYHFDQIAAWTSDEVAWVDANLEGFKGRVTRDEWVAQAKLLAAGEETEFSKRVDDGDVPSSQ